MRSLLLSAVLFFYVSASAQTLTPTRLQMLNSSTKAMVNKRVDKNGDNCSVILVDVVGEKNLKFKEAVGETEYSLNEYTVYIPAGTNQLTCTLNKKTACEVLFDNFGLEIEKNRTYRLTLETDSKQRSAVFYVVPSNAKVTIEHDGNNENLQLDKSGSGMIELPAGTYNYSVSAIGFESETGSFVLDDDHIIARNEIQLSEINYDLQIGCSEAEASLFVDDYPLGYITDSKLVQLPEGKHRIRIVKEGFYDFEKYVNMPEDEGFLNVAMKEMKAKVIKHRQERTKTFITMRSHTNYSFDGLTFLDDKFASDIVRLSASRCSYYAGLFTFRWAVNLGVAMFSEENSRLVDDYYGKLVEPGNQFPFYADIPCQVGICIPLDIYNRSHFSVYGGLYGSYYYLGHKDSSLSGPLDNDFLTRQTASDGASTTTLDWGLRVNAMLYIKNFILGVEGNKSMGEKDFGMSFGISVGKRIFVDSK